MRSATFTIAAVLATFLVVAQVVPATTSSFTGTTGSDGNLVTAAADWTAPEIAAAVLEQSGGGTGTLQAGARFRVFADATDSGNPASGIATITVDLAGLATTASAALEPGSWSVGGRTYRYRSAELTATAAPAPGQHSMTVRAVDAAGNAPVTLSLPVAVADGPFAGADFTTTDRAGNSGLAQERDEIRFVYNRAPDPTSLLAGWGGGTTEVTVLLADGRLYGGSSGDDLLGVLGPDGQLLPLGYVTLDGDYAYGGTTVRFTSSTMRLDGATVEIVLGRPSSWPRDDGKSHRPTWTPSPEARDSFGAAADPTPVLQSGTARRQF